MNHSSTYVLTIPKHSSYSIEHNNNGETLVRVTGNVRENNWVHKPTIGELLKRYRVEVEQDDGYGWVRLEFLPLDVPISKQEFSEFFVEHLRPSGSIEEWEKISQNVYNVLFADANDDPANAGHYSKKWNEQHYKAWTINATTPDYSLTNELSGWLLIKTKMNNQKLNDLLSRYGHIEDMNDTDALYRLKDDLYVALYSEGRNNDAWLKGTMEKLSQVDKKKYPLTIRPLTQDDVDLLS